MRLASQQMVCDFDKLCCLSGIEAQRLRRLSPSPLPPELRGEWVRKDLGREREEFLANTQSQTVMSSECLRMFRSSATTPVWGY